ncbi:MAG: methyltransferase domain-containing protein [Myxococcales bacterium]|nr:methyltransferase domain-containing protein [Myxococcales bacterium]MCB9709299.1 methyltransferase domain-containing protein [Myxococcales bacterium]
MEATEFDEAIDPRYTARIGKSIVEKLPGGSNETVLELACRTGTLTLEILRKLGPKGRIIAMDADPEMLDLARYKSRLETGKRVFFSTLLPVEQWRFEDGVFDTVIGNLPFDELADPTTVFEAVRRLLVPRGHVLLTRLLRQSFGEILDMFEEVAHARREERVFQRITTIRDRYLDEAHFQASFEALGFEHIVVETAEYTLSFSSATDVFLDPLIRAIAFKEWQWIGEASNDPAEFQHQVLHALETYFLGQHIAVTLRYGILSARCPG